jgi:hypothetical protein
MKAKICKRPVENEEQKYIYTVKIGFVGNLAIENSIDCFLQEVLEAHFLERGESVDFCYIDQINKKR